MRAELEPGGMRAGVDELLVKVIDVLVIIVEACGAAVIIIGAAWAFLLFLWVGIRDRSARSFVPVRLTLGRFLALGLEFQLAGDVLRTAVAPSWEEIGQLAAIAAIRTALNYFLAKEIAEERREIGEDVGSSEAPPDDDGRTASAARAGRAG